MKLIALKDKCDGKHYQIMCKQLNIHATYYITYPNYYESTGIRNVGKDFVA